MYSSLNQTLWISVYQNQNTLLIPGGIVFVPDAPCKVEIEISHEWKQEIKIKI